MYFATQSVGTVVGGVLTDRMDRRRLLMHLCLWSLPAHLAAVAEFQDVGYTVLAVPKNSILSREADDKPKSGPTEARTAKKGLYSSIEREEASVKANVERTGGAVVHVVTPSAESAISRSMATSRCQR